MLHGREPELAAIDALLASARAGRGRAMFVTGEAGLGKSTLLGEAATRAGGVVLAGGAWESPGAPPYWPWIQVMRAATTRFGPRVQELPGVQAIENLATGPANDTLDPAAARFALLDALSRTLIYLSQEEPLVIVIDDLHAADNPSLELLELLCREIPRAAIAIFGGWRDAELANRPDAARRLARASRHATVHSLRRLTAAEVTAWIGVDGPAIHETSEGNPLFVEELLRARRAGVPARGIATVLDDHLALVSAPTREILGAASVLGREVDLELLRDLVARPAAAISSSLREAELAGLGAPHGPRWVFRHVLLRDHLYRELAPERKAQLHRAAGRAFERRGNSLTTAAHHLLAGVTDDPEVIASAVSTAREAAARAIKVHAFEDAAALLAAALRTLEGSPDAAVTERIDLRLELSRARQAAGALDGGQAEAVRAATLARGHRDPDRLARSALAYATELASGRRNQLMIDLLEEALAALPPGDSPLRTRVTARLGAALVPQLDPTDLRPYELANEAVAMAERGGDDETRLFARRFALHAHGFRLGLRETFAPATDVITIAERLGRPLDALEHRSWMINAHLAVGDVAAADAATQPFMQLLERLPQPHYRWRIPILRATRATLRGDFVEADRSITIARDLAREHDIDRARLCCMFAGISVALASRSQARAVAILDEARAVSIPLGGGIGAAIHGCVLVLAGRPEEARGVLGTVGFVPPIGLTQFLVEAGLGLRDRALVARGVEALGPAAVQAPMALGPSLSLIMCPLGIVIGESFVLLDRSAEAIEPIERGLELSRRLAAPPFVARGLAALAAALTARGHAGDRERTRAIRTEAATLVQADESPQITGLAAPVVSLEMTREGERVCVRWRGRDLSVPGAKGFDYLAALIARPGSELHVADLTGEEDRGDAGEVLDAAARAAYRAHAEELTAELDTARDRNDLGRIDRLTAELEAITDQLLAATGLGGRSRRAGSRVERCRVNVQRRIRDAIRRLANEDETLGRYLDATIRTGTYCSYCPLHT